MLKNLKAQIYEIDSEQKLNESMVLLRNERLPDNVQLYDN